jgi:Leucine-rich repeat (LRR) protein
MFTRCSDDDKEEPVVIPTSLTIDKASFLVDASASKESFVVSSNKDWTAKTESSWLTLSPVSGKADSRLSVEISISANTETEPRNAVITVTADDKIVDVEVKQNGKVIIPGIEIGDEKFKRYLVENFDADGDGEISTGEAETVTVMDCSGKEIESLAGLEHFVNLDVLNCNSNLLTKIDLSKNLLLTTFTCDSNKIDSLGVSENTGIKVLSCKSNVLTKLDVSGNLGLTDLDCGSNLLVNVDISKNVLLKTFTCPENELTVLDISKNVALTALICANNNLTALDVSKNVSLAKLDCRNNKSLEKISLAENQAIPELLYDQETTKLEYPSPEKNIVDIPDAKFKAYLVENFDTDKDGEISEDEALEIKDIRCLRKEIASLSGISSFTNLEVLMCNENKLSSIDVSKNLRLEELSCSGNELRNLDVSRSVLLTKLTCYSCGLTALNLSANTELLELNCSNNNLTTLDVSNNALLQKLFCQKNDLKILDLRKNTAINTLNCTENPNLVTVYMEKGQNVDFLYIDTPPTTIIYPNYISVKDATLMTYLLENFDIDGDGRISEVEAKKVTAIDCSKLGVSTLEGIGQFTGLTSLICSGNNLTSVDISSNTGLVTFICDSNQLTKLDISRNTALVSFNCSQNALTSLIVSSNKELKTIICNDNKLLSLSVTSNTKLETLLCQNNYIMRIMDLSNNLSLKTMNCKNNPNLSRLYLRAGQEIENLMKDDAAEIKYFGAEELGVDVPDSDFKTYLVDNFDKNGDGEISHAEALSVKSIDCSNLGIGSLSGIENFTNLVTLVCDGNNLTSLPISANTALELLNFSDNDLTSVDLTNCANLKKLYCRRNNLTALNVMYNAELTHIDCQNNSLTTLNVRRNPNLQTLICYGNGSGFILYMASSQSSVSVTTDGSVVTTDIVGVVITDVMFEDYLISNFDRNGDGSLDTNEQNAITEINCKNMNISTLQGIATFQNLSILKCEENKLTSLDLTGNTRLTIVYCNDNKLTSIKVNTCLSLNWLYCPGNLLTTLDLHENLALNMLDCTDNPGLRTVYLSQAHHSAGMVRKDSQTNLVFQ